MEAFSMIAWSLFSKTLTFCVAAVSLNYVLRYFDKRNGIDWKRNYDVLDNSSAGLGTYFGLRILAVAVLAAWVYG